MIKGKLINLIKVNKTNFNILYQFVTDKDVMGNFQKTYSCSFKELKKKILRNRKSNYFLIRDVKNKNIGFMYYVFENRFNAFEIGGAVVHKERGKGYGFDSHKAIINFLFKNKKADRIQAIISTENKIEFDLLENCGMKLEGILKSAGKLDKNHDLAIFAILNK